MFFTICLLCVAGLPFIQCKQLHEYMTEDEVMSIFHRPHHLVPEYEVVPVLHRMNKRQTNENGTEVKIKAFEHDLELYLRPTEGILASEKTPVWSVISDPSSPEGIRYKKVPHAMKLVGITLQDVDQGSAIVLTPTDDGQVHMNGVLKGALAIKSLPQRVLREVAYGGHNLYEPHHTKNPTDDEFAYTHHHIVYKIPKKGDQDFKITDPESHRQKRNAPKIIYPEVLVVVDYNEYKSLSKNIYNAVRYIVSFWNGVDLRYRLLTTPKIRLNIAGIIIALDDDAIPYLKKSLVPPASLDADVALRGMADYFYREDRFPRDFYDMALLMTPLDLCNMITKDFCDPSTLGYAYVAGACDRNATKHSSEAVGIVEDKGGFDGIIPMAHEVGHLIGARHDGNAKDGETCAPHEGFIMTSGLMLSEKGFEWSKCTINAFYKFINEDRAKCLYNDPVALGKQVARILPGKVMSLDEQCNKILGTKACNKDATACTRLECAYPEVEGYCRATSPAAEGSSCGEDLYCLNGKCVLEEAATKKQGVKVKDKLRDHIPKFISQAIKYIPWI